MLRAAVEVDDATGHGAASAERSFRGDNYAAFGSSLPPSSIPGSARTQVAWTRNRLIILGALLVIAIFSAAGLLIANQHTAALAQSEHDTSNLAQLLAEQTSRAIQPADLIIRELAGRLTASADGQDSPGWGSKATFDLLVERLRGLPQVTAFVVIGSNGHMVNVSRIFPAPALDISERDYFQYFSTHDDHAPFVSAPLRSYLDDKWTVFFARRLNDEKTGRFAGIVGAAVTISYLSDFYRGITPEHGTVTLLRRDGLILARYPTTTQPVGIKLSPDAPWYKLIDGDRQANSPLNYIDAQANMVSIRSLREFPLVVNVSMNRAAALSNWNQEALWLLAGAVFAAICVISLVRIFGTQYGLLARQNADLEIGRIQFYAVLNNMSQGVTFFDHRQNLIVCNHHYREVYKLSPDQTRPGTSLRQIINWRVLAGSFPNMTPTEYLVRRKTLVNAGKEFDIIDEFRDGRAVSMHYRPLPNGGWVVTHEDISERRSTAATLAFMARHDPLTELPNRILFHERLIQAIAMTGQGTHCALLCLDLDRFKVVNDSMGHPMGDALLRAVAGRLSALARTSDTVARLGGDEFAIILVDLKSPGHAAGLARRIVATLHEPYDIEGQRIMVGVSIGISIAPKDGNSLDTLLKNADIALYMAKTEGRGTYHFFEPAIDSYVQKQRTIEMELRNTVPEKDFELHYQPILDLGSGKVTGFEALIRWNHPERGLISPAEFIPIAEETGLIVPIGAWALQKACQEATGWPAQIEIAVNLSPVQFKRGHLLEVVQGALAASGLKPDRLELEITETLLLESSADRLALLHQLRALGVRVALDDFGTGYSSLSYLRSFPFNKIKIDRSFVREVDTSKESATIVAAIVGLGHGLGMTTVAEGVETSQQLRAVRDLGCEKVQGYLFSRPRPASEVLGLIRTLRVPGPAEDGPDEGVELMERAPEQVSQFLIEATGSDRLAIFGADSN